MVSENIKMNMDLERERELVPSRDRNHFKEGKDYSPSRFGVQFITELSFL
jgi:hypothetical protein